MRLSPPHLVCCQKENDEEVKIEEEKNEKLEEKLQTSDIEH